MKGRKRQMEIVPQLLRTLAVAILLLLASGAARAAAYPGNYDYFCSWTEGTAKGYSASTMSTVQATTVSDWRSGTLVTTKVNGRTASYPVQLLRPTTVMGGRGTQWIFRQQNPNVSCDFYVIDDGEELLWEHCSDGSTRRCGAVIRRVGRTTDPCNCEGIQDRVQYAQCLLRCLGNRGREACTQDLVSVVRCFANYLQIINSHPNQWGWDIIFGEGRACQESSQCPGGTWCVTGACKRQGIRETGSPCTETGQCPSGNVCSAGICTSERDANPH